MLICPKCKCEYEEGYTTCNDCKCELIEKLEVKEENISIKKISKIGQFAIGVLLIFCSPMISYKLTSMYFISNGSGQYNNEQFIWMLNAYHYSFLLVGGIICLSCVLYWYKNLEK